MTGRVLSLNVGQPRPFNGAELSAIDKSPVAGKVFIGKLGLAGDAQADQVHHGGEDMAVHHYAHDHYAGWSEALGGHELLETTAAFGENICAVGLTESEVLIGDRYRLGSALLEVSQPRQPCWKIEHRFARKHMLKRIIATHVCGWYYRVLEEGHAEAGDLLELVEAGHPGWTIKRVFAAMLDPAYASTAGEMRDIANLAKLTPGWRERASERAAR